jgi:hypothetical protein
MSIGFPKPRPALLEKRQARADRDRIDREERAKVRVRSEGRCEVWAIVVALFVFDKATMRSIEPPPTMVMRCKRRASENHHLLGGIGRRNRGRSILAAHRLDVCAKCHQEITGKVLVPCVTQDQAECAATVRYERVK